MKRLKLLLIYGTFVLGLALTACGQKSDKDSGVSASQSDLVSPATATDNSANMVLSTAPVSNENISQGAEITQSSTSDITDGAVKAGTKDSDVADITDAPVATEKPVLSRGVGVPGGRTPTDTPTPVPVTEITEVSKTMYPSIKVNVREESNSSSKLLGSYDVNESVHVTGLCDNGWARIDFNGTVAYIFYQYLSDSKVVTPTPTNTPTPKPATPTPTPNAATPTPQSSGTVPFTDSHGKHTFNQTYHNNGQSYYKQNLDIIEEHLECVNELRASVGVAPLTLDYTVSQIASYRTAEMVDLNFFSHNHPNASGSKCFTDIVYFYQNGYTLIGENISNISGDWNYFYRRDQLGEVLFTQFRDSPTHYANMVNARYTKIGLGVYVSDDYVLITQIFE